MIENRNVILATSVGYRSSDIESFLLSWSQHVSSADLYVFTQIGGEPDLSCFPLAKTVVIEQIHGQHIQSGRYRAYLDFLVDNLGKYERYLLTDIRDVIFQADPFAVRWSSDLILAAEDLMFGAELWNRCWILDMYGHLILEQMARTTVSCSGTTIGTEKGILRYLAAMTNEISCNAKWNSGKGYDQGVHNFLIWTKRLGKFHLDRNMDLIATVGATQADDLSFRAGKIERQGRWSPIVHQWDRHEVLVNSRNFGR